MFVPRLASYLGFFFCELSMYILCLGFPGDTSGKEPANEGDIRDTGLTPGLVRCPGGGHDNPLQYSCLENPMDRGAKWAIIHGVVGLDMTKKT